MANNALVPSLSLNIYAWTEGDEAAEIARAMGNGGEAASDRLRAVTGTEPSQTRFGRLEDFARIIGLQRQEMPSTT